MSKKGDHHHPGLIHHQWKAPDQDLRRWHPELGRQISRRKTRLSQLEQSLIYQNDVSLSKYPLFNRPDQAVIADLNQIYL